MMSTKKSLSPNEMIALLGLLKGKSVQYPPELLAARRADFAAQVKNANLPTTSKTPGAQQTSGVQQMWGVSAHALESALQYVLAGMVVLLVGAAAYSFRDELRDLFSGDVPTEVQIVDTAPPTPPALTEEVADTETPSPTPDLVVGTPEPNQEQPSSAQEQPTLVGQEQPPEATPTKPGLHLGQTKTPQENKKK